MTAKQLEAFNRIKTLYWDWHRETQKFKPVFDKSDGEGLRKMVIYLLSLKDDVDEVVKMFEYILNNWDKLDPFYKKNTRLRQINGNIHNIIATFKSEQTTKNTTGVSEEYLRQMASDLSDTEGCD